MKKTITLSLGSIIALGLMSFGILSSSGSKTNRTGGHGETTCNVSGCHSGSPVNSGGGNITVSLSPDPALTSGYISNATYTVSLTVTQTTMPLFGIDFQALNFHDSTMNEGTLTAGTDNQKLTASNGLVNITHILNGGLTTDSHTFVFTWVAPSNGDTVKFWYAGLAANHNSNTSGDFCYNGSSVFYASSVGTKEHIASNLNLSIFPNPISESANISYELGKNSTVSATLINVTGQVVTTFFNKEEQTAGKQNRKLVIEPSIAKGIYFVAINVNGKKSYKKIVVE